jgi:hypothetical protein
VLDVLQQFRREKLERFRGKIPPVPRVTAVDRHHRGWQIPNHRVGYRGRIYRPGIHLVTAD